MQVDGWPSSFHPGCTRLVSLLIASLRRRRGALAALWGQTGAVVGRPLAGGGIPAGEGGGRRVGIQASRWAGDSQPRRWTHDELWVQNGPDQQHRGTDGNVNVHFKNQEHLNTNRQKHSELSTVHLNIYIRELTQFLVLFCLILSIEPFKMFSVVCNLKPSTNVPLSPAHWTFNPWKLPRK